MRNHLVECKEDIKDIQHAVKLKTGVSVTSAEACSIWEEYSETYSADWMGLGETPDEIWQQLQRIDLTNYVGWVASDLKYEH